MTWTKAEIRQARQRPLAPILARRGLQLKPLPQENFRVAQYDDLVVKSSYWRWPSRGLDGNAIDFFVRVEGMSFSEAMRILADSAPPPVEPARGEPACPELVEAVEPANP